MSKWVVTLEITIDARGRYDALNKAFDLTCNLPGAMLYDAKAAQQAVAVDDACLCNDALLLIGRNGKPVNICQ